MSYKKRIILVIGSALLMAFSMPSMGISVPVWFSFAILLMCLDSLKSSKGFVLGYIYGYFYYSVAFWWLMPAFIREIPKTFNSFPPVVGFLIYIVAGLFVGLYFGFFGFVFSWFSKKFKHHVFLLIGATLSLLLFTEYLRSLPPLKFIGFRFTDALFDMNGIMQLASIGGTELLLILIAVINLLIFIKWKKDGFSKGLVITSFMLIFLVYTCDSLIASFLPPPYRQTTEKISIAGVQTMITPLNKYYASEDELLKDFSLLMDEVERTVPDTDLFVLPETYFLYDINKYPNTIEKLEAYSSETAMRIVVPHVYENTASYYNAVQMVYPESGLGEEFYGKLELNPFTEYLPFEKLMGFFSFLKFRNYLEKGTDFTTFDVEGLKAGFPICFESFFPNVFIDLKKNDADFFCVITNDGYFTYKMALTQHFKQLQIRAVETNSWICHVSNNGITGLVDPFGRIIQDSKPFERMISYMDIPKEHRASTVYMFIYEFMAIFIVGFFCLFLIISFVIK